MVGSYDTMDFVAQDRGLLRLNGKEGTTMFCQKRLNGDKSGGEHKNLANKRLAAGKCSSEPGNLATTRSLDGWLADWLTGEPILAASSKARF